MNKPPLLYKYYFYGIKEPVTIEAENAAIARRILTRALPDLGDYARSKIIGETVQTLVTGVTKLRVNGKWYLWVGLEKTTSGWQEIVK